MKRIRQSILLAIVTIVLFNVSEMAMQNQARTYRIIDAQSQFTIFAGKAGLLSGMAHDHTIAVRAFTGQVIVPANGLSGATVEMEIDAHGLKVVDKGVSDKDRAEIQSEMESKVLEVSRFPKIMFKSVSVRDLKSEGKDWRLLLDGDLTLHGITKRVTIPVIANMTPEQMRASGEITIQQTDFGIKPYSKGLGAVKVKNELKISFTIVAQS